MRLWYILSTYHRVRRTPVTVKLWGFLRKFQHNRKIKFLWSKPIWDPVYVLSWPSLLEYQKICVHAFCNSFFLELYHYMKQFSLISPYLRFQEPNFDFFNKSQDPDVSIIMRQSSRVLKTLTLALSTSLKIFFSRWCIMLSKWVHKMLYRMIMMLYWLFDA